MLKEMGEDEEDEYDDDINEVDEFWICFMTMQAVLQIHTLDGDNKNASIFCQKYVSKYVKLFLPQ